jgi:hypothetical protein
MSFVLVASIKSLEGRLYHRGAPATVATPQATTITSADLSSTDSAAESPAAEISPQHDSANRSGQ